MTADLILKNTMTRSKAPFVPLDPNHVRMYVCGPTVYDRIHIGNARPLVAFDLLYRVLSKLFPKVTYVRNITDVDDKINARAAENGETISALTERTTIAFHTDAAAMGVLPPTVEPRATEHIGEMIAMITALVEKGHAYEAEGHVLFHVPSDPNYGRLSGRSRDEMIAGARVEVASYKKDPADFVLWKPSEPDLPGWDSPWGRGRPGWHIECSAMSAKYLGKNFDIHGGGLDLVFPHHENEIAQSCCASDGDFAQVWMHNGYLMVEGEKMSKSLGNFFTVEELLAQYPGEALRFYLMSSHYAAPFDFTHDGITQAKARLDRYYRALQACREAGLTPQADCAPPQAVMAALSDDLNTALAISEMDQMASRLLSGEMGDGLLTDFMGGAQLMGLLTSEPEAWFKWVPEGQAGGLSDEDIDALILKRNEARKNKDFAEADRVRDLLKDADVVLEDGAGGTTWRRG